MTLQQRYARWFEACGLKKVVIRSAKYICYVTEIAEGKKVFYFLGSAGAVRKNITPNVTDSISITDRGIKAKLEAWERAKEL